MVSGPIPPYNNPPIEPQYYQPSRFVISGITLGSTTTITTTANVNYVVLQQVRILVPPAYGCIEIDGQTGFVLSLPNPNQVVVSINSSRYSAFISSIFPTQPQIVAIGDINSGPINANGSQFQNIYIPGSFINISPN